VSLIYQYHLVSLVLVFIDKFFSINLTILELTALPRALNAALSFDGNDKPSGFGSFKPLPSNISILPAMIGIGVLVKQEMERSCFF